MSAGARSSACATKPYLAMSHLASDIEPGVVPGPQWRPASDLEAASPTVMWVGVGRKA